MAPPGCGQRSGGSSYQPPQPPPSPQLPATTNVECTDTAGTEQLNQLADRRQLNIKKEMTLRKLLKMPSKDERADSAVAAEVAVESTGRGTAEAAAVEACAGATAAEQLNQLAVRRQLNTSKEMALRKLLKMPSKGDRAESAVAAVVAVESTGRGTAAAAAVETGARATAAAGVSDTNFISQGAVVEAVALAVEIEVEAQPSSSSSFARLKDNTDQLFIACQGLESTATAVAAAVAAGEASVLAGAAVAAWAVVDGLNKEVEERDRIKEGSVELVTEEHTIRAQQEETSKGMIQSGDHLEGVGRSVEEPKTITGTAPPEHGDHDSHDSGSTYIQQSSESNGEEGGQSEGTGEQGKQCLTPPAEASPCPMPMPPVQQQMQQQPQQQQQQQQQPTLINYFANFGGTCYPVEAQRPPPPQQHAAHQSWVAIDGMFADPRVYSASPPNEYVQQQQQQQQQQQEEEEWGSWGYEGNVDGSYPVPSPRNQQQQDFSFAYYCPENLAGPCYPNPNGESLQAQAWEYGDDVAGVCPVQTERYVLQQGFGYGNNFAGMCHAHPMVYGGTTYYC